MRQIGTLPTESQAQRFAAYLITQDIVAQAEEDDDGYVVWVRDENHLEQAVDELKQFQLDPDGRCYQGAEKHAAEIRRQESERQQQARKNVVHMRGKWKNPNSQPRVVTWTVIAICGLLTLYTNFGRPKNETAKTVFNKLTFSENGLSESNWESLRSLSKGEVWRVVTPVLLHGSSMHLIFNMMWLYQLGGVLEGRLGRWRFLALMLAIAVISNLLPAFFPRELWGGIPSFWQVSTAGIGFSGVVFGLLGFLWIKSRFDPFFGVRLQPSTVSIMLIWLLLGFSGALFYLFKIHIDNWGHVFGMIVGMAIAYAPVLLRKMR